MKMIVLWRMILLVIIAFSSTAFVNDLIQKKSIRTKEFDYKFSVSLKKRKTSQDKMYYWFKTGEIHNSFGDAGGQLLHEEFLKFYIGNNLAEKGSFEYGLKVGEWKNWYPNGSVKEEIKFVNGVKSGDYLFYNEEGDVVIQGKYHNGKKNSVWINNKTKDTLWYRNNKVFDEHPRILRKRKDSLARKQSLFKKLFKKKDSVKRKKPKKPKKEPTFFKKLFSKKNKDNSRNKEKSKKNG